MTQMRKYWQTDCVRSQERLHLWIRGFLERLPPVNTFPMSPYTCPTDAVPTFGIAIIVNCLPAHILRLLSGTATRIDSQPFGTFFPCQYLSNESLYVANGRFPDFWRCNHHKSLASTQIAHYLGNRSMYCQTDFYSGIYSSVAFQGYQERRDSCPESSANIFIIVMCSVSPFPSSHHPTVFKFYVLYLILKSSTIPFE